MRDDDHVSPRVLAVLVDVGVLIGLSICVWGIIAMFLVLVIKLL